MTDDRLVLSAPAVPESLEVVHAMLAQLWASAGEVADRDRMRFEMAVIEIVANVVEHAYARDASTGRRFEISLVADEERLVATLGDNGLPMELDMSAVTMPDDELAESGRGLALATAALDDLRYERVEGRNRWTLVCLRQPA
ncbi:ATP-binding protein [Nocardioides sp. SYSU DS0663]|uniref:ATP-binding protein n=1 Tax=Nocardioides sp. SYSU DS0663 TaxID=3416445 RepID=UPI003F4BEC1D